MSFSPSNVKSALSMYPLNVFEKFLFSITYRNKIECMCDMLFGLVQIIYVNEHTFSYARTLIYVENYYYYHYYTRTCVLRLLCMVTEII